MEAFNLTKVLEYYKPDINSLAAILFPAVKHPKLALDRVIRGEATLDIEQVQSLASYLGVFITDLLTIDCWKSVDSPHESLVLKKGEYTARLNYKGSFLVLHKGSELIKEEVINTAMPVSEFIDHLNNLIKNFKKDENESNN